MENMIDSFLLVKYMEERAREHGRDFSELCERAGVYESTLYRWISGKRWPTNATIKRLNDAFKEASPKD